jgi:hypothetical protein
MKVLVIYEWDIVSKPMLDKYLKYGKETREFFEKIFKENKVRTSMWAKGTGNIVWLLEFEDIDDFSKLWSNEKYQRSVVGISHFVDNMTMRVFHPAK